MNYKGQVGGREKGLSRKQQVCGLHTNIKMQKEVFVLFIALFTVMMKYYKRLYKSIPRQLAL